MRIGIDCRLGGLAHAGIGRYCEQLVYHLVQGDFSNGDFSNSDATQHHNITWVLFFYSQSQIDQSSLFRKIVLSPRVEVIFTAVRHYTIAEQVFMPLHFYRAQLDLLHVPHFNVPVLYRKPFVVTIHDLLWHHYQGTSVTTLPKAIYWLKYLGYRFISTQAISRAQRIFVPAKTVAADLESTLGVSQKRITVTYEGVDRDSLKTVHTTNSETTVDPSLLKKKYLIFVGSLYPHKNIKIVLEALQQHIDISLIIVGSRNVFQDSVKEQVKAMGLSQRVHFLGFVPDSALSVLYKHALALIQPSFSEGFGLTGIEAMSVGTPVIASNIEVFKELYGKSALFFDPFSVQDLSDAISKLTHLNSEKRAQFIKAGQKHVDQFDWNTMARTTFVNYFNSTS